jgi:predicted ester cyclase
MDPNKQNTIAEPLQRSHMPTDYAISLKNYTDNFTVQIPKDFGPSQSLAGFEDTYRNIIDYIVRITHRIWDDRDIEYIRSCYAMNSRVFDDFGLQIGNQKIVTDTRHTIGAFSDMAVPAKEVIWAGDDRVGFHTSHRTSLHGTNDGDSKYGPATGKQIDVLVIANCVSKGNDIFLEHVLYNTGAMLKQLGIDPMAEAARLVKNPLPGWPRDQKTWDALRKEGGASKPLSITEPVAGFDPDRFTRMLHDRIWNRSDMNTLADCFASNLVFEGPTDRKVSGVKAYREFAADLKNSFPEMTLQIDEVYWMGNESEGYAVSTRWSAEAQHEGSGLYGEPTGAACQIWGITQQEIIDGRVCREWMLFNEFDVMMQIAAARKQSL